MAATTQNLGGLKHLGNSSTGLDNPARRSLRRNRLRRQMFGTALAAMSMTPLLHAQITGTWIGTSATGNWNDTTQWFNGNVANAGGAGTFSTSITAATNVNLNVDVNLSALNFTTNSTTNIYTLSSSTNALTLSGTGAASLTGGQANLNLPVSGTLTKVGGGALVITGNTVNATGGATISSGGIVIAGGTLANPGSISINAGSLDITSGKLDGTGVINVNGGSLVIDNGATVNDKINDSAPITLGGGTIQFLAAASTTSEAMGAVTLSKSSTFGLTSASGVGKNTVASISNLTRSGTGAILLLRGSSLGQGTTPPTSGDAYLTISDSGNLATFLTQLVGSNTSTWSTTTVNNAILPWAVGDTSGTNTGNTFISYVSGRGFVALATGNYDTTITAGGTTVDNVRLTGTTPVAVGSDTTINSLVTTGTAGGTSGAGVLTITSGAILSTASASIANPVNFGAAGAREAVISSIGTGTTTFSGALTTSVGLTKYGSGTAVLAANNTISGQITIGTNPSATSGGGALVVGAGTTSGSIGSGNIVLANGTFVVNQSGSPSYGNVISGNGTVIQAGPGTLTLTSSNSYTGGTAVPAGTLVLGASGAVGPGGTFEMLNSNGALFDLAGFNQQVNGLTTATGTSITNSNSSTPSVLTIGNTANRTAAGQINGNLSINHTGTATESFSNTGNTYTGRLTISNGGITAASLSEQGSASSIGTGAVDPSIHLGGPGTTGILDYTGTSLTLNTRPIVIETGGVGGISVVSKLTLPATSLTGSGTFAKLNSGTVSFTGGGTFSGNVVIGKSVLAVDTLANIGVVSGLGTGDATPTSSTVLLSDGVSGDAATLEFDGTSPASTNRPFQVNTIGTSSTNIDTNGSLTLTGGINTTSAATGAGVQSIVFNGAGWTGNIAITTNPITGNGIVVQGAGGGTLLLATSNSYSGGTQIKGGWCIVSNDNNLGAASGPLIFTTPLSGTPAGTLQTSAGITSTRAVSVLLNSVGTIDTIGNNSTFGALSGAGTLSVLGGGNVGLTNITSTGLLVGSATSASGTGTVTVTGARSPANTSKLSTLVIAGSTDNWTAALDLNQNDLVYPYTTSPITTVANQLKSGFHGGDWNGTGIRSSAAAASLASGHPMALGYGDSSKVPIASGGSFSGTSFTGSAVLIRYTYSGDADLNGTVNSSDFDLLTAHFGATSSVGWTEGDYNYDGTVNALDFNALATNYGQGALTPAPVPCDLISSAASLGSVVPEPCITGALGSMLAMLVYPSRRRRR